MDLCTIQSNNNKSDLLKEEDFFTIKTQTQTDCLVDIINNLTKNSFHKIKFSNQKGSTQTNNEMYIEDQDHHKQKRSSAPISINNTNSKSRTNSKNKSNSNNKNNSSKSKNKNEKSKIKSPKSSMCNLYKKNQFFGNKSMHNLLFTSNNNTKEIKESNISSKITKNNPNQYRLYSPSFSSKSSLTQFKKCKPQTKQNKNSFNVKSSITDAFKYKNSFKHSIVNYSLSNNMNTNPINSKSNCVSSQNTNKKNAAKHSLDYKATWNKAMNSQKSSKSKTNRNKKSISPKSNLIMTYLTNCLGNQVGIGPSMTIKDTSKQKSKNKIFSLRSTNSINTSIKCVKSKKHNPLILNYFNKVPNKVLTSKNSTNNSKILKSNQSLDTIFKKIKKPNHSTNNSSTNNNSNNNYKKEVNLNVNVNLNNIHININTNNDTNLQHKNKTGNNPKRGSIKEKNVPQEMESILCGLKSNLNSNRIINDLVFINKNKSNHFDSGLSSGIKNSSGKVTISRGNSAKGSSEIKGRNKHFLKKKNY